MDQQRQETLRICAQWFRKGASGSSGGKGGNDGPYGKGGKGDKGGKGGKGGHDDSNDDECRTSDFEIEWAVSPLHRDSPEWETEPLFCLQVFDHLKGIPNRDWRALAPNFALGRRDPYGYLQHVLKGHFEFNGCCGPIFEEWHPGPIVFPHCRRL